MVYGAPVHHPKASGRGVSGFISTSSEPTTRVLFVCIQNAVVLNLTDILHSCLISEADTLGDKAHVARQNGYLEGWLG